ncbi:hypothetical protein F5B20DRAFT_169858 [Whalleya microplaca]|nr:hypothetical protein F5B20DRAFT_169858 [Whalleya microplaca]
MFSLEFSDVAGASRLTARQGPAGGNSSVVQPPSSNIETETTAPALSSASPSQSGTPAESPKQERGPQGPDSVESPGFVGYETVNPSSLITEPTPSLEPEPSEQTPAPTTQPTAISTSSEVDASTFVTSFSSTAADSTESLPTSTLTSNSLISSAFSPTDTLITSEETLILITTTLGSGLGPTTLTLTSDSLPPTETATMSTLSSNSDSSNAGDDNGNRSLTIALSTVFSIIGVLLIAGVAYWYTRGRRRRGALFNRGITPIGDDEIATWKSNRPDEKETDHYTSRLSHSHNPSTSTSTHKKAPSLIQYQNGGRPSLDVGPPRTFSTNTKYSFDLPQSPGAVLARAPNARSGLTDEMVPGDDPFLPSPKRQPSRLHKAPPNSPGTNYRTTRGSRSSSMKSSVEPWHGALEASPRGSSDANLRGGHNRLFSFSSIAAINFGENDQLTGLSPPPSRRNNDIRNNDIGRALG